MAIEHRTDLIPAPPIQTRVYPVLMMMGFAIPMSALIILAIVATTASDVFAFSGVDRSGGGHRPTSNPSWRSRSRKRSRARNVKRAPQADR